MMRNSKGFTLIELMIVVVIIGILAAIAIPNFITMQDLALEGSTRSNAHTLQLAVEDFAGQHDGTYPVPSDSAQVVALIPGGEAPINPFTGKPTQINWGREAENPGQIGYVTSGTNQYDISGYGAGSAIPTAGFSSFIYGITYPFAIPFLTVFRQTQVEGSIFEWTTLLAMLVYWLVAWGIIKMLVMSKSVTTPEASQKLDQQE